MECLNVTKIVHAVLEQTSAVNLWNITTNTVVSFSVTDSSSVAYNSATVSISQTESPFTRLG